MIATAVCSWRAVYNRSDLHVLARAVRRLLKTAPFWIVLVSSCCHAVDNSSISACLGNSSFRAVAQQSVPVCVWATAGSPLLVNSRFACVLENSCWRAVLR